MKTERTYFRRKLPHYQPTHAIYFITFRLEGTLPGEVIERLRDEREKELRAVGQGQDGILSYEVHEKYFEKYDSLLDGTASGPTWLNDNRVAQIVADALHSGTENGTICFAIALWRIMCTLCLRREDSLMDCPTRQNYLKCRATL